jgi:hypothetical protein
LRARALVLALGVAALGSSPVIGCGGDVEPGGGGSGAGGSVASDLPCEVAEFLGSRCQECHASPPQFGAPMPLVTRANLLAAASDGGPVVERAIARMRAEERMPPPPREAASDDEVAILEQWIAGGHPTRPSGDTCEGEGGAGGMEPLPCTPDVLLTAASPFEMPATSTDEQICFGIEGPAIAAKRHITTIAPRIDNSAIIHHMLLLQAPEAVSPDPAPCDFVQLDWKLLYAWGPGTPPHILPDAAGFPLEADEETHFVLQIHYNNLQGLEGQTDQSGIDLCTTETLREHDADIMAFGGMSFPALAPMARSQLECETPIPFEVAAFLPVTIFQSWPHMHQLGAELHSFVENTSKMQPLAEVSDYDFNYQVTYPTEAEIAVGDTVRTTCTWENDTSSEVTFGENTDNEMCFNFLSYYPRVAADFWHWLLPAQGAQCDMTVLE